MTLFRMLTIVMSIIFLAVANVAGAVPDKEVPDVVGKNAVLIDAVSGKILYAKDEHAKAYPASTTKILTALVALEKGNLSDKVKIGKNPPIADGSSIWLQESEEITLEELIYALMLNSANDAAVAIAEHIGGSVDGFTKLMNEKAKALGAVNSNFVNPNGLPNPKHYTTANDLALIAKAAMENPKFREITGTKYKDINRTPADALTRLANHNKLLWRFEGANGIKTGYTVLAQQCLVGSAKRGDQEFICVVLGSVGKNIWQDVSGLLEYGFANFQTVKLVEANQLVKSVPVEDGTTLVQAVTARSLAYTVSRGATVAPKTRLVLANNLKAPLAKGTLVGKVIYNIDGQDIGHVELLAANNVEQKKLPYTLFLGIGGGFLTVIFLGFGAKIIFLRIRRRKQRRARLYGIR